MCANGKYAVYIMEDTGKSTVGIVDADRPGNLFWRIGFSCLAYLAEKKAEAKGENTT